MTTSDTRRPPLPFATLVDTLEQCDPYPDCPLQVERVETHISVVFLTERFAYKLKKPLRFDFLDYSTPAARQQACEEEVRLNRRLAPEVYLGVEPVVRDRRGRIRIGGEGTTLDWLVKMKRLPADQTLEHRVKAGQISADDIDRLTARLVAFYRGLPPLSVKTDVYRRKIEQHVAANRGELLRPEHGLSTVLVKRVHTALLQQLRLEPEKLDNRVRDGRIVEGHGDLRPEHIYFTPQPVVVDGIEFNAEFRQLDVLDELSFLAMECAGLGAESVGNQIIQQYCLRADDHAPISLLRFYESYRACVRAKVHALRAEQQTGAARTNSLARARDYLLLADRYVCELGRPLLLVVRGLSGVGKSVLAGTLAESLGCDLLQTDVVRGDLFAAAPQPTAYDQDLYSSRNRRLVYEEVFRRAEQRLRDGVSVILDGTFLSVGTRRQAIELAKQAGALGLIVRCTCPDDVARQRIVERTAERTAEQAFEPVRDAAYASDALPEHVAQQREEDEPDTWDLPVATVDTTTSVPEMQAIVFAALATLARQSPSPPSSAARLTGEPA